MPSPWRMILTKYKMYWTFWESEQRSLGPQIQSWKHLTTTLLKNYLRNKQTFHSTCVLMISSMWSRKIKPSPDPKTHQNRRSFKLARHPSSLSSSEWSQIILWIWTCDLNYKDEYCLMTNSIVTYSVLDCDIRPPWLINYFLCMHVY